MGNLQRRSGSNLSRTQRVDRAFKLGVAAVALGAAGIVGLVIGSGALVVVGFVGAGISGFLARNTLRPRR
ncbi:hypothetical protein SK069_13200 [Patulibacter brassicae]|jgi:hypothetical protein|uniref:Uncharacterized protein n=1 Tax=Patulibacter brassicae TaxID=1705717 RepID=A0ABU4VL24_9ACTN|nr:hypothetical protein [Patulibacter brassicae]MDX8152556.1 hypothetical protein [Patulibacter brassicae]